LPSFSIAEKEAKSLGRRTLLENYGSFRCLNPKLATLKQGFGDASLPLFSYEIVLMAGNSSEI